MKQLLKLTTIILTVSTIPIAVKAETPSIIVQSTKIPVTEEKTGDNIIIITKSDIEKLEVKNIEDVLKTATGIAISDNGWGEVSNVYIYGLNKKYILFLVNGIPVNDPSTPDGTVDLSLLNLSDVERIEILKGPQSALYGSEAVAGVVNIITKPDGKSSIHLEYGSYNTLKSTVKAGLKKGTSLFDIFFTNFRTDGYDIKGDGDRESANYKTIGYTFSSFLTENLKVKNYFNYKTGESEYDNGLEKYHRLTATLNGKLLLSPKTIARVDLGTSQSQRNFDDYDFGTHTYYSGSTYYADANIKTEISKFLTLVPSISHRVDVADTTTYSDKSQQTDSASLNGYVKLHNLNILTGVRKDHFSSFGTFTSYKLAGSYTVKMTKTTLKLQYGKSFKAPSIDQLYGEYPNWNFYGNPNLQPEKSKSLTAGIEQKFGNCGTAGVSYFKTEINDVITTTYDPAKGYLTYINGNRGKTEGSESFVNLKLPLKSNLKASYTHTHSIWNNGYGWEPTLRLPEDMYKISFSKNVQKASITLSAIHYGKRYDYNFSTWPANKVTLPPFTIYNCYISVKFRKNLTGYVKFINITDKDYQLAYGYNEPGRSIFAGLKLVF
ncbi:TonB-dependent receptor plug domain-containing protein [Desulfurobacterium sp.]